MLIRFTQSLRKPGWQKLCHLVILFPGTCGLGGPAAGKKTDAVENYNCL